MLAGNEGKLVRRVVSFHKGDRFERDLVSISGVTTYIERIPVQDNREMRAWVLQLDKYVDYVAPPENTALAGINENDDGELSSARVDSAQMRDEARREDQKRSEEELDRLAAEGRSRRGLDAQPREPERPANPEPPRSSFSRVDDGSEPEPPRNQQGRGYDDDSYVRPAGGGARYSDRNSEGYVDGRPAQRDVPPADARMTYDSTRRPDMQQNAAPDVRRQAPRQRVKRAIPKPVEEVIRSLELDGVMFESVLADGSFLHYVLERRMIFKAWRRGWINKRTRAYISDSSVYQGALAELRMAGVRLDVLLRRNSATPEKRIQRINQSDVIFETAENLLADINEVGSDTVTLSGKMLVCDTIKPDQVDELDRLGLSRVGVLTPMPEGIYLTTAELESILAMIYGKEPRYLHISDWDKVMDDARMGQEMFSLHP